VSDIFEAVISKARKLALMSDPAASRACFSSCVCDIVIDVVYFTKIMELYTAFAVNAGLELGKKSNRSLIVML